jgi:hypothetical protein
MKAATDSCWPCQQARVGVVQQLGDQRSLQGCCMAHLSKPALRQTLACLHRKDGCLL